MRFISLSEAKVDMVLASPVIDNQGRMLLNRNCKLSPNHLRKLAELNHKGLYIFDELSEGIDAEDEIPLELRLSAIESAKDLNIDSCMLLAGQMVENLMKVGYIATNLTNLSLFDNDTYNHCVNVASYAALVGISLGYNMDMLTNLVVAGLLHDIGKEAIPIEILNKPGKLTDEERALMNEHPTIGYELVKDLDIPAVIKVGIYAHHENYDGSGYPRGLTGDKTHEVARILKVCDVYDAMISKRIYKDHINPIDVVEYLYGGCGTYFDLDIVKAFTSRLMPYPKGVSLVLSNGEKAIVKDNNKDFPFRPIVRLEATKEDINLVQHNNLTITGFDCYVT